MLAWSTKPLSHEPVGTPAVARMNGPVPVAGFAGTAVTLARAIQTSVYERFGIRLEPEPVVV